MMISEDAGLSGITPVVPLKPGFKRFWQKIGWLLQLDDFRLQFNDVTLKITTKNTEEIGDFYKPIQVICYWESGHHLKPLTRQALREQS
jgi:hypothetical protein